MDHYLTFSYSLPLCNVKYMLDSTGYYVVKKMVNFSQAKKIKNLLGRLSFRVNKLLHLDWG